MKDIRIELLVNGRTLLVDVVCDCGNNALVDEATGGAKFKHEITMGDDREDKILICGCGKKYRLRPQKYHIHVFSE